MAVTITPNLTLLYDGNTSWDGASTYSGFQRFGTACNGALVSNTTSHFVDAVPSFSLVGNAIYSWVNGPASIGTFAQGGFRIVIGDGTNERAYYVGGRDVPAFRAGGWDCCVLQGDNLPPDYDQLSGSAEPNLSAITRVGIGFTTVAKSVGSSPNVFFDVTRYGTGLTIAGGTALDPGKFDEIATADLSTANAWGVFRKVDEGIYGAQGKLIFGATDADSYFVEENAMLFFESRVVGDAFYELNVQGSGAHTNLFQLGEKSGTGEDAIGTDGVTIQSDRPLSIDFTDANIDVLTYGSTFYSVKAGVTFGENTACEAISCSFAQCGQVALGRVFARNCSFDATVADAAMLWNDNVNVRRCTFSGNLHGIEHPAEGAYTYVNLRFAGNTYDVEFSAASGTLTILNTEGSNAASYQITGGGTSVDIQLAVNFTFHVSPAITGYLWHIYDVTATGSLVGAIELAGEESATLSEQTYTYNYADFGGDTAAAVQIITPRGQASDGTDYEESVSYYTLSDFDQSVTITLQEDINN